MVDFDFQNESISLDSRILFFLNYQPIVSIQKELLPGFLQAIKDSFTQPEEVKSFIWQMMQKSGEAPQQESSTVSQWRFTDKDKLVGAVIGPEALIVEAPKLQSFSPFRTFVEILIGAFTKAYQDVKFTKIALRVIHTVIIKTGNALTWDGYISPSFRTAIPNSESETNGLARVIVQRVYKKENCLAIFNFGLPNPEFPNVITRRQFVLDVECNTKDVSPDVVKQVDEFRNLVRELLISSTENLLKDHVGAWYA